MKKKFYFLCNLNGSIIKLTSKANNSDEAIALLKTKHRNIAIIGEADRSVGIGVKEKSRFTNHEYTTEELKNRVNYLNKQQKGDLIG